MGLNPIEYRPWDGQRSKHARRFLVIADSILRHNLRSKWFLAVLIVGTFLAFALNIIFTSITPHESLTPELMASQMNNGLFYIFMVILVSMVCSDLLAEDSRSNSLVLYLSRALRPEGYLLGKLTGAFITLAIFGLFPPIILAIAVTATQSGPDYLSSAKVILETVVAGIWATFFLIPIGLMVSSLTSRRTYAAVGTFMALFVLGIISGIFVQFDANWQLLDPGSVLAMSMNVIFGLGLPEQVDTWLFGAAIFAFTIPPLILVYWRILRKGVGK
ncbi:MAG: ABC transporter permease [Methanomassiliicoccales archaeon]|jgi:ABC-type transport system involved in multi-copper enzyme maturation permease subunit|nr:ABC transporter permease [Methanomassiliicoccales archaeon]